MPVTSKANPLKTGPQATTQSDLDAIAKLGNARKKLKEEIAKVIVGQEHIVDDLLTAVFARGHFLMIGVPGLAKTRAAIVGEYNVTCATWPRWCCGTAS